MSQLQPADTAEWVRQKNKEIAQLQRRGSIADLGYNGTIRRGLLDQSYVGPGPANVTFEGYPAISTNKFDWLVPYDPAGSRSVNLVRVDGSWMILGQSGAYGQGGWERIVPLNSWVNYGREYSAPGWRDDAMVVKLSSGIVMLSGLLAKGLVTHDTIIAQLPAGYEPDTDMIFPVNNSDTAKAIKVSSTGAIRVVGSGWVVNGYVSLDGIAYPAAGVADWVTITTFANGWVDYGNASYGVARYWVDEYNMVWYAGMISGGTTTANTTMFTMPVGARSSREEHIRVASNNGFGCVGPKPNGDVVIKTNTSNAWISLAGATTITPALNSASGLQSVVYQNGWTTLSDATYGTPAVTRRADGFCYGRGLMASGTVGSVTCFKVRPEHRPSRHIIITGVSADAAGRIDFNGNEDPGNVMVPQGSSSWFSLDSIKWYPGGPH